MAWDPETEVAGLVRDDGVRERASPNTIAQQSHGGTGDRSLASRLQHSTFERGAGTEFDLDVLLGRDKVRNEKAGVVRVADDQSDIPEDLEIIV